MNDFLPWGQEWFDEGIRKENYRVTHKCIKNEWNKYRPTWLEPEQSVRDRVVSFFGKRIDKSRHSSIGDQSVDRGSPNVRHEQVQRVRGRNRTFALFGPRLSSMSLSANSNLSTSTDQADLDISTYELYHKGFKRSLGDADAVGDVQLNENLKAEYDTNPRFFGVTLPTVWLWEVDWGSSRDIYSQFSQGQQDLSGNFLAWDIY